MISLGDKAECSGCRQYLAGVLVGVEAPGHLQIGIQHQQNKKRKEKYNG